MAPAHEPMDEAKRLRSEIEQQNREIVRLERFAGTVHASRFSLVPDYVSETQVSKTTTRIIEQLQRELDAMRLTAESARLQFEAEHRDRLTLIKKCDDLQVSLASVRQEVKAHGPSLARSDQALATARANALELREKLQESQSNVASLQISLEQERETTLSLRQSLDREVQCRLRSETNLNALLDGTQGFKKNISYRIEDLVVSQEMLRSQLRSRSITDQMMLDEVKLQRKRHEDLLKSTKEQYHNIESVREAYLAQIRAKLRSLEQSVATGLENCATLEANAKEIDVNMDEALVLYSSNKR